ncbi:major capsid protein [Comamonadaceae bacterium PP-2]
MAHMDIFKQKGFGMVELTAAVQNVPFLPTYLGSLNLFDSRPVRTKSVSIESKDGKLSVIQSSERGAPLQQAESGKRTLRSFDTVRIAKGATIMADTIEGIRAFGTESELQSVQNEVADKLNGATGLLSEIALTHENMRLGAIQGVVYDADGTVIINWFEEFGISQPAEINFALTTGSSADQPAVIRQKCNQVVRAVQKGAAGGWVPGRTYVMALCGDGFFDKLTTHPEVRQTYLNQQAASELRGDVGRAFSAFTYGDITFVNYRGSDDGKVGIGSEKCQFFPVGLPGGFQMAYSPAEFLPFVNTPGLPVYALVVLDKDRQAWVKPEAYSYPLPICTRPAMLQRAKAA